MDWIGPILEILKCIGPPLRKYIEYHRKLDEYEGKLREVLDDLNNRKKDIELSLRTECDKGKLPKKEVEKWLENIEGITSDARKIEQYKTSRGKFFWRARVGELVDKKIQEVKEYCEKSSSFHTLVIDPPPAPGTMLPTEELVGQTTTVEEIWGYLMGNVVKKIGVWGMGGVGKTTFMMDIHNRLLKQAGDKFDNVIWVTVSQTVDVLKLQKEIAIALNQHLPETENKIRRAGMLQEMLQKKRFVLILDDVWETIQLKELGIPEQDKCKLVLTTRSMDVCRSMGCKAVEVKTLPNDEALKLFLDKVGHDILQVPTLKEIVESIVEQCAGLPLAIVTISGSMKGVHEVREWRNALNELLNNIKSVKGVDDVIFGRLKFSYDRLNDNKIQHCFLYCALYPEDYNIPKDELVESWITEGLVDEMDNVEDTEDKAHSILSRLVNNCLLLESKDRYSGRAAVKLHDVARDMVLTHITSKSPIFMVKAGLKLKELPNEQEWKENVEKVSLMKNWIEEIPSDASPNCPKLSTLLLQGNIYLGRISEPFFIHMKELKILNLSKTSIESLPDSISDLTNLTTLLLVECHNIKRVPWLSKLLALKNLNLEGTSIENVPEGFEMLTNLRNLNIFSKSLRELPVGVLPKLRYLRKFKMFWGSKTLQTTVKESATLKELDTFVAFFENLQDSEFYFKCLKAHNLVPNKYFIATGPKENFLGEWRLLLDSASLKFDKCILLMDYNICEREDSILLSKDVQWLGLRACKDVISISDVPSFNTLERLEFLLLVSLPKLTVLFEISKLPPFPYSNLKVVEIIYCVKLKNLFSSKLLPELKNLEEIHVHFCEGMEEIIAMNVDDKEEEKELSLPKLRILRLSENPNLKRVCGSHGMMVCDSLQEILIWRCSRLISRLPFRLPTDENGRSTPPPALKKIKVETEWWEALDPNSKTLLLPYCQLDSIFGSDSE